VARGPDAELVDVVSTAVVVALEVVGSAVDTGDAGAGSVVPLQLGVHTLEAVRDQLHFVPGLSHTGRLPTSTPKGMSENTVKSWVHRQRMSGMLVHRQAMNANTANPIDDGRHDFDFLAGTWRVHHRKLDDPTDPAGEEWVEFEGIQWMRQTLGGLGNVDNLRVEKMPDGRSFEGMSVRLFDPGAAGGGFDGPQQPCPGSWTRRCQGAGVGSTACSAARTW
jgi:hypothetical protein